MVERTKGTKAAPPTSVQARVAAMSPEVIQRPVGDMGGYLQAVRALVSAARDHEALLLATPMTPEADLTAAELGDLRDGVALLITVQDEQERRQGAAALTPAQKKSYAAARREERTVVAAIRHAFRDDAKVRAWCTEVLRGDGVADLHDDTRKLTGFWAGHDGTLARFTDAKAALGRLVTLDAALPAVAVPDAEADKRHTRLRNAAWTFVDRIAARVCVAGRFALAGDPAQRKRFRRFATRKAHAPKKG